ncbi:hypothetical protein FRB94_002769 [Tulasnella sp. JGI-2019a]|nr:hypothetical protein FRB94_002769 [Tulasnella sp. JGI-2019a]KAG9012391.1 hypothetical protein FRB93_001814 [Tulasnella sp. JGI-2019a]KAG9031408.1 hypothetical protein FRB95_002772 [Tulasnella sp. JGI-2019a]
MKYLPLLASIFATISIVSAKETVGDAAHIARELIQTSSIGTLSSTYPSGHDLAGQPFGLMEYYAPCYANGSLAILFFGISQNGRNILASPGQAASISIQSPPSYSLATKPRVALVGNVTVFSSHYEGGEALKECYKQSHPDAWWVPGNKAGVHDAVWARFDPHTIYFVGGFGGMHYIGHIPLDIFQNAHAASPPRMRIQGQ